MKSYLDKIDTTTLGNRYDVTPLFADADSFDQLIIDLSVPFKDNRPDCVACIDALGFILGTAVASRLGVGVIPIRKGGKLPVEVDFETFKDYTGETKRLEIRKDAFRPQSRVLLVDEWIETGAQAKAAIKLIETQDGVIVGVAAINMDVNDSTAGISSRYPVHTVRPAEDEKL